MTKPFVELVISSPYILVKGFLMGFLTGGDHQVSYYFSRRHGIQTETLAEHLKEWLGFENFVYLCMERAIMPQFLKAIHTNQKKLGMEVISCRAILSASFQLEARLLNKDSANRFREKLDRLGEHDVSVTLSADRELAVPAWQDVGVGILTSLPPYQYAIDAGISGPLESILPFHRKLRDEILVDTSTIKLKLGDECLKELDH